MRKFMDEDFLLQSEAARELYHDYAAAMPIYDFHCHLDPRQIAEDRRFDNLGQIWLDGDHYKWRAMRAAGVSEALITGKESSDYEKYLAWAKTVPRTLGNPLYHWTHLELRRPFGITDRLLGPETAQSIWDDCCEKLATPAFSVRGIMQQMQVRMVGTTDDPVDTLAWHRQIAADDNIPVEVLPSWRPDKIFKIELEGFVDYLASLEAAADVAIDSFDALRRALLRRLDHFSAHGCRAADHGIETLRFAPVPDDATLDAILARRRHGETLEELDIARFATAVLVWLGGEYARRGWVMQLHIGAIRNTNTRLFRLLGPDCGGDSIGDRSIAWPLAHLLDSMDRQDRLPRTLLYGVNPGDNEMLATMSGNFTEAGIAGKVQLGAAWWFNDQKDGILRQLEQTAQMGLLSQFVGMLTDSRSFISYTRHEYFRRILCNRLGEWITEGSVPDDRKWLGSMVQDICFNNAVRYFAPPPQ